MASPTRMYWGGIAVLVVASLVRATVQGEERALGMDARLRRCLENGDCARRLSDVLGSDGAGGVNSSNASVDTGRSFDLPENPLVLEFPEADSAVDIGSEYDQAGKVTLAFYGDMRGLLATGDPKTGKAVYGVMGMPVVLKVALLAFTNGLVVEPPARRAKISYQFLWADTCKEPETNTTKGAKCQAPYALQLILPLVTGRSADVAPAYSYLPPARALVGGQKWTTFVASLAGSQGLPNVGHFTSDAALSDKLVYPSFVRADPTELSTFRAFLAVLQKFNFTVVDVLSCDTAQYRASATGFMNLAVLSGMSAAEFSIPPEEYSAYPAGGKYDMAGGVVNPARSLQKKMRWDSAVGGMKSFNAHAHMNLMGMATECPMFDVLHYAALDGLFGAGHMWLGQIPGALMVVYQLVYIDAITNHMVNGVLVDDAYGTVTPMDNYISLGDPQVGTAKGEFWELMAYVGKNRATLLGPELEDAVPASAFQSAADSVWRVPYSEYLVDAVFTLLRAINDVVLEVGEAFTNAELLAKIQSTDFVGITGRVRFDATGDRIQDLTLVQYRLPPGTKTMLRGMTVQTVQVATYSDTLTITSPFLFRAEEGRKATPPPDKDLLCDAGQAYDRTGGVCRVCSPGTFTARTGKPECDLCIPGSYAPSNGSRSCLPCPEGFAAAAAGSTACEACAAGRYNDAVQQSNCRPCEVGTYAPAAASVCHLCPQGTYAGGRGHEQCDRCEGVLTTRDQGSTEAADCLCPAGSYRDAAERSTCRTCPDGMSCALGCDAIFLPLVIDGNCTGIDDRCVVPQAGPRYMSRAQEPLRSFLCLDDVACPGGPPGTCGELRDSDTVACGRCVRGAHKDKKRCSPCRKGVNVLGVVVAVAVCVVVLGFVVYAGNRELILQSNSTFTIMVVSGITLSAIQTMGVFRNLALEWFEPLNAIFSALMLVGFNLEILNLECIVKPNAATMYLFRQLAGPFALFVLGVTVLVKKRYRRDIDMLVEYTNSAGTVFTAVFISIASSCVLPLICYKHPGNNGESLLGDPTMLCWESRDHISTIAIGAVIFAIILVPFMALTVYGTVRHPDLVAQSVRGKGRALSAYRFLFVRFRPEAYFYGSLLLLRGLCICLVPVVIRYDVAFQVCAMSTLLLLAMGVQLQVQPWRSLLANIVDGAATSGLILFLVCGSAGSDLTANKESIRILGSIIFAGLCASLFLGILIGLVRYMRPTPYFQWFICHHKRDAGAQARLLKIIMELWKQTAFIDSDDLRDLDQLFDVVKCAVGHLLVYLTRDVLTRPWCAGEIATAAKKGLPMSGILTPSWVLPHEEAIAAEALPKYLDLNSTSLEQYSITFEHVAAAFRYLLSDAVPKVAAADGLRGQARFHSIVLQLLKRSKNEVPAEPRPGMLIVSSDPADDEATASAAILVSKVQLALFSFMPEGALLLVDGGVPDESVQETLWTARAVTVVLSRHSLQSLDQLRVIGYSMSRLRANKQAGDSRLPPFEVIPLTTPSFEFPPKEYYESTLPGVWPEHEEFKAKDLGGLLRSFFKRLAVNFSTHASAAVLDSQAQQLVDRVPTKWQAAGLFDDIRTQGLRGRMRMVYTMTDDSSQMSHNSKEVVSQGSKEVAERASYASVEVAERASYASVEVVEPGTHPEGHPWLPEAALDVIGAPGDMLRAMM